MNNEKQWLQKIAGIKTSLNESFGGYVDLKPVNRLSEEMDTEEDEDQYASKRPAKSGPAITNELEKPKKIYADDDDYVLDTDEMMLIGGEQIEKSIMSLLDSGFKPEDILDMCEMFVDGHSDFARKRKKLEGKDKLKPLGELEKPKKVYATDDSEDEKGFDAPGSKYEDDVDPDTGIPYMDDEEDSADMSNYDYMDSQYGLQVAQLAKEMIDDGFEPDDAAEFFRGFAARMDKGGFMKDDLDEELKPSGELEW
jgi:hypothetical protein